MDLRRLPAWLPGHGGEVEVEVEVELELELELDMRTAVSTDHSCLGEIHVSVSIKRFTIHVSVTVHEKRSAVVFKLDALTCKRLSLDFEGVALIVEIPCCTCKSGLECSKRVDVCLRTTTTSNTRFEPVKTVVATWRQQVETRVSEHTDVVSMKKERVPRLRAVCPRAF